MFFLWDEFYNLYHFNAFGWKKFVKKARPSKLAYREALDKTKQTL